MRNKLNFTIAVCVAIATVACNETGPRPEVAPPVPVTPTPLPPRPPRPATVRTITLDDVVEDNIQNDDVPCTTDGPWPVPCRYFQLLAPRDGTLVARLFWNVQADDFLLMLRLEDTEFRPTGPAWSPVVARLSVRAGQQYRLAVGLAGGDVYGDGRFF
jgi:hypothetical protein